MTCVQETNVMQVFECQFSRPFNFLCQRHTLTPLEEGEREGRKTNTSVPRLGHLRPDGWLWAVVGNRQPPSPGSPEWSAPTRNSWLEHAVPHFVKGEGPVKTCLWRDKTPADSLLYNAAIALPICGNEQKRFNKESNWFLGEVRGEESPRSRCEQTAITLEEEEHARVGISHAEARRRPLAPAPRARPSWRDHRSRRTAVCGAAGWQTTRRRVTPCSLWPRSSGLVQ